jgi:predicted Zn-dependent protease
VGGEAFGGGEFGGEASQEDTEDERDTEENEAARLSAGLIALAPDRLPAHPTTLLPSALEPDLDERTPVPLSEEPTDPRPAAGPAPRQAPLTANLSPHAGSRRSTRLLLGLRHLLWAQKGKDERPPALPVASIALGLFGAAALLALGTLATRQVRQWQWAQRAAPVREAAESALRRGTLPDLTAAARGHDDLLALVPTDGPALAARALLLAEAVYEFGGPPAREAVLGLREESRRAVRLVQGDPSPEARAAQAYQALHEADLVAAEALAPQRVAPYVRCQVAWLRGRTQEALRHCTQAAAEQPGRALWRLRLAALLAEVGRGAEAAREIGVVLARYPGHPGATLERLLLPASQHPGGDLQVARALQELAPRVASSAERARLHMKLAQLALRRTPGDPEQARKALAAAAALIDSGPAAVVLRERLALGWEQARDPAAAEREARQVVARAPGRPRARLILAQALLRRGQGDEALQALAPLVDPALGPALGPAPEVHEALLLKARALVSLDQTQEAQRVVAEAQARARDAMERGDARLLQAWILLQLGDVSEARLLVLPLVESDPGGVCDPASSHRCEQGQRAWLLLCQAQLAMRPPQREAARARLEWLISHAQPAVSAQARVVLGRLLAEMGQAREAAEHLEAALQVEEVPGARRELASLLLAQGRADLARRQCDVLLGSAEDHELLLLAARAHRLSGDPVGALRVLQRVRPGREDDEARIERARALLKLGRAAEVVVLLREAAQTTRRPSLFGLHLRGLVEAGDAGQARETLAEVRRFRSQPGSWWHDPDVQLAAVRLLLLEGRRKQAQDAAAALAGRLRGGAEEGELRELALRARDLADQAGQPE